MVKQYQLSAQMGSAGIRPTALTEQNMLATKQIPLYEMLVQLLQKVQSMQNQSSTLSSNGTRPIDNGAQTQVNNPKTGQPYRRYSWTRGCYAHWGNYCPKKGKGHKSEATLRNCMKGSGANCF